MKNKQFLQIAVLLITIAASAWFIWRTQFAAPKFNVSLQQGIGEALAQETIQLLGGRGKIVVITMPDGDSDLLAAQYDAFRAALKKSQVQIDDKVTVNSEKKGKYRPGLGLSARALAAEVKKNRQAAAIVSFVGLPSLDEAEMAAMGDRVPPMIAFSRNRDKLQPLLKGGLLKAAVVPRFEFPAPGPKNPRTPREWFVNQFQFLTPAQLSTRAQ